jgi:hypothetical protein
MTNIKFFSTTDPRLFDEEAEVWVRENLKVVAIEQIDNSPSAYFIYRFKDGKQDFENDFTLVVKSKTFFREHFNDYSDAMEVINRVKDLNYGR